MLLRVESLLRLKTQRRPAEGQLKNAKATHMQRAASLMHHETETKANPAPPKKKESTKKIIYIYIYIIIYTYIYIPGAVLIINFAHVMVPKKRLLVFVLPCCLPAPESLLFGLLSLTSSSLSGYLFAFCRFNRAS